MSRLPAAHRTLSHATLRDRLFAAVQAGFDSGAPGVWDPTRDDGALDLGRGVLDAFALALHVLWTYQEAWAEETFLATARLDESVDRLLGHIGYRPSPGTAATGIQYFRCRAGLPASLPPGVAVKSQARGTELDATFETLEAVHIDPDLNELHVFLPSEEDVVPPPPPVETVLPNGDLTSSLLGRLNDEQIGSKNTRDIIQARQNVFRLNDALAIGAKNTVPCANALAGACEKLAELQQLADQPLPAPPPLSHAQEVLARQLRRMRDRKSEAVGLLETALGRCAGESTAEYGARLGAMVAFLDHFVSGMIQDARDQVTLLHGVGALARLDRRFGKSGSMLGQAPVGCDTFYLVPATSVRPVPGVRPGDRFVLAEDVDIADAAGNVTRQRFYREWVRVVRAVDSKPDGYPTLLTRITFDPPLQRSYTLDDLVLLGNMVPVSEGAVVDETAVISADRRVITLSREPLTWLRDPLSPSGRRPEVQLFVAGRPWERREDLLDAGGADAVFAVEPVAGGGTVLRVGDGVLGAQLPDGAAVRVHYRVGLGAEGNRAAGRLDTLAGAHPSVETTFNPFPTTGGADPEPRALARVRGPAVVAAADRAVSLSDVRSLALSFDGVLRARAFRRGTARRSRVVVAVAGPGGAELVAADLDRLRLHLTLRIPPGITVNTENRVSVPVRARVLLRHERGVDPLQVVRRARLALGFDQDADSPAGLLDPSRVDIDDDLSISDLYRALEDIDGLHSVVVNELHRDGDAGLYERIVTGPTELLAWARPTDGTEGIELPYEEIKDL